ncbi:MAG: hypothetical protein RLZZ141_1, partial [Pseudomonadota bacterium]
LLAGHDIELDHAMVLVCRVFSRGIALALLRHHMDQNRAVIEFFGVL